MLIISTLMECAAGPHSARTQQFLLFFGALVLLVSPFAPSETSGAQFPTGRVGRRNNENRTDENDEEEESGRPCVCLCVCSSDVPLLHFPLFSPPLSACWSAKEPTLSDFGKK